MLELAFNTLRGFELEIAGLRRAEGNPLHTAMMTLHFKKKFQKSCYFF